ncbi:hypothetical protein JCM3766R1_007095 [Sporobolomyces carnicolor]
MQATTPRLAGLVPRTRPLPARKRVLFAQHEHLLSSNDLVLFLRPGDFTAQEWRALRSQISQIPTTTIGGGGGGAKLTLLRPGLLPALLRDNPAAAQLERSHLASRSHLSGPLAVLTCETLSPPALAKVLKLVSHYSKTPAANSAPAAKGQPPVERLAVLSSILERRVACDSTETKRVATLPPLDVLRSQLVGLLSTPASRIVGVVGASASNVSRTVEGFKEGLKGESSAEPIP